MGIHISLRQYERLLLMAATLVASLAQAETQWQGTITTDVTWTKAASPHRVVGAGVTIAPGVTVTIQAGARVVLPPTETITVNGSLLAQGVAEDPITVGGLDEQSRGHYLLFSSSSRSELRYTIFSHMYSIFVSSTSPQGNHLFDHCQFSDFTSYCVELDSAPARILNSIFRNNSTFAVLVHYGVDFSDSSTPLIMNNVIDKNGLYVGGFRPGNCNAGQRNFFIGNRVCGGTGVFVGVENTWEYVSIQGVKISSCNLRACNPSVATGEYGGGGNPYGCVLNVVVTSCDLTNISNGGTSICGGSRIQSLAGNYWGKDNTSEILSRMNQPLDPSILLPLAHTSLFPQADVDNSDDGNATTQADADLVKKYLVGLAPLTSTQLDVADVDRDGKVDIRDALMIESYVKALIWKLPAR
jgi:hypothetical protein